MRKSDDAAAPSADDALHAEDFFKFFIDKIIQIQKETDPDTEYASNPGTSFSMFQPTTAKHLEDVIAAAPSKHCLLDTAPTSQIKNCASLLSPYLSVLFNRLLEEAYLPISQKAAIIKPLIKKRGLHMNVRKNYKHVSNLTFVFKLLERLVSLQLTAFLEASGALPLTQSAYRKFHSTESALLKIYSDLCLAIGKGHIALPELHDLSAAFDTVDHEILLKQLESSYGITGSSLNWMRSDITDTSSQLMFVWRSQLKYGSTVEYLKGQYLDPCCLCSTRRTQ